MARMRAAIMEHRFPDFIREFLRAQFPKGHYPDWLREALLSVRIEI